MPPGGLDALESPDIPTILKTVGMALVSSVGGAAGPLYGTFFLRMATECAGRETLGPIRSFRTPGPRTTLAIGSCAAQFGPVFDRIA